METNTSLSDQTREELLAALSELGRLRPGWRLGQTLVNFAMMTGRLDAGGVWDLQDDEALAAAKTLADPYKSIENKPPPTHCQLTATQTMNVLQALEHFGKKPGMYLGAETIQLAQTFLVGFHFALELVFDLEYLE